MVFSCQNEPNDANSNDFQEVQVDMSDFTLLVIDDGLTGKSAQGEDKCFAMNDLA